MGAAPLCSILIPSRARPARLWKAIRSFWASNPGPGEVEVCVRLDIDDEVGAAPAVIAELEHAGVRVLIGPRHQGYRTLARFYDELSAVATAPWIWIWNDDAHLARASDYVKLGHHEHTRRMAKWAHARPWFEQLRRIPDIGAIVQAEMYKLGGSAYFDCDGSAFPIVPRDAWKLIGFEHPEEPIDTWLDTRLRVDNGWRTEFLTNVAAVHERDDDAALEIHRRM